MQLLQNVWPHGEITGSSGASKHSPHSISVLGPPAPAAAPPPGDIIHINDNGVGQIIIIGFFSGPWLEAQQPFLAELICHSLGVQLFTAGSPQATAGVLPMNKGAPGMSSGWCG
jgi:hypothetical protein